jgi:hypothetical protein
MSETTIYHNRTRCIVDPHLQRKFIVEALSECDKADMIAHFRFLEARIAKEKLHTCKQGTLVNLDLIPDSIIQILYNRVCVSLE